MPRRESAMTNSKDDQKHVRIALKSVTCRDTEDLTGADEFYVAGGAGTGSLSGHKSKAILTKPIDINTNETKLFPVEQAVVFDDNVAVDDFVEVGLEFMDKDFEVEDFDPKYQALVLALTTAVGAAVGSLVAPGVGTVAGAILGATPGALVKVMATMDKDDLLGTVQKRFDLKDYPEGRHGPYEWSFADGKKEGSVWSTWDYSVAYVIDVGPAK
ncbi:glycine zipper domain-containing protein [Streptomyces wuyuanensis]|uniref:glycine zipper domain-containing protein n=1 Tax=Streptomyces wuyuanensis TaxID=1196353 RepID=UPI003691A1EC